MNAMKLVELVLQVFQLLVKHVLLLYTITMVNVSKVVQKLITTQMKIIQMHKFVIIAMKIAINVLDPLMENAHIVMVDIISMKTNAWSHVQMDIMKMIPLENATNVMTLV